MMVCASAHKSVTETPSEVLAFQPNMVHILMIVRILAEYKPIFVFGQYPSEREVSHKGSYKYFSSTIVYFISCSNYTR